MIGAPFFLGGGGEAFQTSIKKQATRGAAIQYQRIQCQHTQSQRFVNFYCYLLTIYCKYEQLLYIFLSKKTNIWRMTSDLFGSNQQFQSNQTRGVGTKCVGTKCVGTKQLRLLNVNEKFSVVEKVMSSIVLYFRKENITTITISKLFIEG